MSKMCPLMDKEACEFWLDYIFNKEDLEQANELLSYNWKEICYLHNRINTLEKYIRSIGGTVPPVD